MIICGIENNKFHSYSKIIFNVKCMDSITIIALKDFSIGSLNNRDCLWELPFGTVLVQYHLLPTHVLWSRKVIFPLMFEFCYFPPKTSCLLSSVLEHCVILCNMGHCFNYVLKSLIRTSFDHLNHLDHLKQKYNILTNILFHYFYLKIADSCCL